MARADFGLNYSNIERLHEAMETYNKNVGRTIDGVLHNEGYTLIRDSIQAILPVSGREWKGKKPAASATDPFRKLTGELSVTVQTKPNYHYLYFPDDGSNTLRHQGGQYFMWRGEQAVESEIVDLCIAKLIENFNKGE